jgi:hypothetical protein
MGLFSWVGEAVGEFFGLGNEETKTTNSVDYVALARNAEKAGFNPKTALLAGGAAGHMTSTTSSPRQGGFFQAAGTAMGSALGSSIGGSLGSGVSNFLSLDPMKSQVQGAELDLLRAQTAHLKGSTAAFGAGGTAVSGKAAGSLAAKNSDVPEIKIGGFSLFPNTDNWSKASDASDWFGEPGDWIVGGGSFLESGINAASKYANETGRAWGRAARDWYFGDEKPLPPRKHPRLPGPAITW